MQTGRQPPYGSALWLVIYIECALEFEWLLVYCKGFVYLTDVLLLAGELDSPRELLHALDVSNGSIGLGCSCPPLLRQ